MDLEPHHDEFASKEVQSATGALKLGGPVPDQQLNHLRDALDEAQNHDGDYEHLWECTKTQLLESTVEIQEIAEQDGDPIASETAATLYRVVQFMRQQEATHTIRTVW